MAGKVYSDTEICLRCVNDNEAFYHQQGRDLHTILSTLVNFPEDCFTEMLRNMDGSQKVLQMNVKQRVLLNERVVRFHPRNDVAGLQEKIANVGLSKHLTEGLKELSLHGYKLLKESGLLDHLVEFDAERLGNVVVYDKMVRMAAFYDMLALVDNKSHVKNKQLQKGCNETKTSTGKSKEKMKPGRGHDDCSDSNFEDVDSEELVDVSSVSEATLSERRLGRAAVTIVLTARNTVPLIHIYRHLIHSYLHTVSKSYILVLHVGPLVEKQKIELYEYKIPPSISKFIKSAKSCYIGKEPDDSKLTGSQHTESEPFQVSLTVKKTSFLSAQLGEVTAKPPKGLNVIELEKEVRQHYGRKIQQLAPLKDYFRYLVHDCPGVKDHYQDKKSRYDRYMAKREKKRERRTEKLAEEPAEEPEVSSDPLEDEVATSRYATCSTARTLKDFDQPIPTAASHTN